MRDQTQTSLAFRKEKHSVFAAALCQVGRTYGSRSQRYHQNIGLHRLIDNHQTGLDNESREFGSFFVILDKTFAVILQRVECRRRENSHLSHAAAKELAESVRSSDEITRTRNSTSDRSAKPFRKANGNRIRILRDLGFPAS